MPPLLSDHSEVSPSSGKSMWTICMKSSCEGEARALEEGVLPAEGPEPRRAPCRVRPGRTGPGVGRPKPVRCVLSEASPRLEPSKVGEPPKRDGLSAPRRGSCVPFILDPPVLGSSSPLSLSSSPAHVCWWVLGAVRFVAVAEPRFCCRFSRARSFLNQTRSLFTVVLPRCFLAAPWFSSSTNFCRL